MMPEITTRYLTNLDTFPGTPPIFDGVILPSQETLAPTLFGVNRDLNYGDDIIKEFEDPQGSASSLANTIPQLSPVDKKPLKRKIEDSSTSSELSSSSRKISLHSKRIQHSGLKTVPAEIDNSSSSPEQVPSNQFELNNMKESYKIGFQTLGQAICESHSSLNQRLNEHEESCAKLKKDAEVSQSLQSSVISHSLTISLLNQNIESLVTLSNQLRTRLDTKAKEFTDLKAESDQLKSEVVELRKELQGANAKIQLLFNCFSLQKSMLETPPQGPTNIQYTPLVSPFAVPACGISQPSLLNNMYPLQPIIPNLQHSSTTVINSRNL